MIPVAQGEGMNAPDFLRNTLPEARKLGERMGTTSPKGEKMKEFLAPSHIDPPTFLKIHLPEARKLGERMGTTSPKLKKKNYYILKIQFFF